MFVQVIEGKIADAERLRQQVDAWNQDLRPGAAGYLGTTAGVTDDGRAICFARFASAADAKANSDRPEQGEWWSATESCFDGDVSFIDSEDVEALLGGGSDDAGFVQVMKSSGVDRAKMQGLDRQFESVASTWRPDLMGMIRVWIGTDRCVEAAYFTSEEAAREGEQSPPPPELADGMADYEALMANTEFIDLRNPWLY